MSSSPTTAALANAGAGRGITIGLTLGVLVPVLLPFLVSFHPEIFLDVDPRMVAQWSPARAFGPTAMSWGQVWAVLVSAFGVAAALWRGARICWGAFALAAVGIGFCLWHMDGPMDDQIRAGAWVAGICLGLAGVHLGQLPEARRWATAALVAMLIPVFLDAIRYVLIEHPAVVDNFMSRRAEILHSRGWAGGSAKALKYEQRLRATDVTGAFGLSNVLGSLTLALTVLSTALSVGLIRTGIARGKPAAWKPNLAAGLPRAGGILIPCILAVLGFIVTWLTHSRGALLTLPAGLVLIAVCWWGGKTNRFRWIGPSLAFGFALLVIAAVLIRGLIDPGGKTLGQLSLLFRFHYWQGAWHMLLAHAPMSWLLGTGPAGFEAAYPKYKNPISPEDVISTHNFAIDYITMLGLGGWALAGLLGLWLWKAAPGSAEAKQEQKHEADQVRSYKPTLVLAMGLGAALFGLQYWIILPELTLAAALGWLLGLLGFVAVVTGLVRIPDTDGLERWTRIGLFAAAACLLIHSQIAMTFFNLASVLPAWFIVGLAAAPHRLDRRPDPLQRGWSSGSPPSPQKTAPAQADRAEEPASPFQAWMKWMKWAPPLAMLGLGLLLFFTHALPITAEQSYVYQAARLMRLGRPQSALRHLGQASNIIAVDDQPLRYRIGLITQLARHQHEQGRDQPARQRLRIAQRIVTNATHHGLSEAKAAQYQSQIQTLRAQLFHDPQTRQQAAQATLQSLDHQPYNPQAHLRGADRLRRLGQPQQARRAYRRALQLSGQYYLDPLAQLSKKQRQRAKRFLARGKPAAR